MYMYFLPYVLLLGAHFCSASSHDKRARFTLLPLIARKSNKIYYTGLLGIRGLQPEEKEKVCRRTTVAHCPEAEYRPLVRKGILKRNLVIFLS